MNTIKIFYMALAKENIPIYGVVSSSVFHFNICVQQRQNTLGEYTTKERDVEKGITRIPLNFSRMTEEDLVNIEFEERAQVKRRRSGGDTSSSTEEKTTRAESVTGMPQIMLTDQLEQDFIHRGQMYQESKKSMINFKGGQEEEMKNLHDNSGERAQSIYCRSSDCEKADLEDFELIKVIGQGSFGKVKKFFNLFSLQVYLVYLPLNQQYYAMKSIRKDIVIDSDSLENIKLEKLILLQVDNPFII